MKLITLSPPFFIPIKKYKNKNKCSVINQSISGSNPPSFNKSSSTSEESIHPHTQTISKEELEAVLRHMAVTEDELAAFLTEADINPSMIKMEHADEAELRETFSLFDMDGDGRISAEELLGILIMLGDERCTIEDCQQMIRVVDRVGDGFVCFDDFACMMEGK